MATVDEVLALPRPASVAEARAHWPQRDEYHASPGDWRDECLYFLMPDRFSDTTDRPPLDRTKLIEARNGADWDDAVWDAWAASGRTRFQGGTLQGVIKRLDYLAGLGVTALWIGPPWKQRRESFVNEQNQEADEYHGYAIQDLFDVDPRFGSRGDLVDLVTQAHQRNIRVIFDIIVNHVARSWLYKVDGVIRPLTDDPRYSPDGRRYDFGVWLNGDGGHLTGAPGADDAVWPVELQNPEIYHRRGQIDGWGGKLMDDQAQFRVADMTSRDLDLGGPSGAPLQVMIACWTYWMSLTDCDGFRIDTLKHIGVGEARIFCSAVREYAETLGKRNFLVSGEVAEGDSLTAATAPPEYQGETWGQAYLDILGQDLTATLEIGDAKAALRRAAALDENSTAFLERYNAPGRGPLPASHRTAGACFVMLLDDHDGLGRDDSSFQRFPMFSVHLPAGPAEDSSELFFQPLQSVPGAAVLLLTLGIPCLYYGTEQGMAGAARYRPWEVPGWQDRGQGGDRYLREAMFGPTHPRPLGAAGRPAAPGATTEDPAAVGFGPFGTVGRHLFDEAGPVYVRVRDLLTVRKDQVALLTGRQYARPATRPGQHPADGDRVDRILAWSRILARQEVLVVVNTNSPPSPPATVQVLIDRGLNPPGTARFRVAASTATHAAPPVATLAVGTLLSVRGNDAAYVVVPDLPPHEVVVLVQEPQP